MGSCVAAELARLGVCLKRVQRSAELLTPKQAAKRLDVSGGALDLMRLRGEILVKRLRGHPMIPTCEVARIIDQRTPRRQT